MRKFLPQLNEKEEQILSSYLTTHTSPVGTLLVEMGSEQQELYFLDAGICEVYQQFTLGRRLFAVRIGVLRAPVMAGELNLIQEGKRMATVIVAQEAQYRVLTGEAYAKLKQEQPVIAVYLLEAIGRTLGERQRNGQQRQLHKIIGDALSSEMVLNNIEKFIGHVIPCPPALAEKLFRQADDIL